MRALALAFALLVAAPAAAQTDPLSQMKLNQFVLLAYRINNGARFTYGPWNSASVWVNTGTVGAANNIGNVSYDKHYRARMLSAAGGGTASSTFANPFFWRGVNAKEGGFDFITRFGVNGGANITIVFGAVMVVGMTTAAAPAFNVDPTTVLTDSYFFGVGPTNSTLQACACDAVPVCSCTDTTLPVTDGAIHLFEARITAPGAGGTTTWSVRDLQTGSATVTGLWAGGPSTTALMHFLTYNSPVATGVNNAHEFWGFTVSFPY